MYNMFICFIQSSTDFAYQTLKSVQVAFNLGNAIGAYCGGLPLQAGMGYQYPALVGAPFALIGFTLLTIFYRKYEKKTLKF